MRIGIIAKAKQGDIFEALDQRGWTQKQGAEFLSMDQSTFGRLLNMSWVPREFSIELTLKLYELTGKSPEELFPHWARQKDFLEMPKVSKKFFEATPLLLQGFAPQHLLAGPEEAFCKEEVKQAIEEALHTLSPREEEVMRRWVMGEEDPEEIGKDFAVDRERVRQIGAKALRKLRGRQSEKLRKCLVSTEF